MSTTEKNRIAWPFPSFEAPSPTVVLYEVTIYRRWKVTRPMYFFNWGEAAVEIREFEEEGGTLADVRVAVVPLQYDPLRTLCEVLNAYGVKDVIARLHGAVHHLPVELPPISVEREQFRMIDKWADPVGLSIEVADLWKEIEALRAAAGEKPIQEVAAEAIEQVTKSDEFDGTMPEDATEIREWAETIYAAYPKKLGRVSAIREITFLLESGEVGPTALLAATERYAQKWVGSGPSDRRWIFRPSTWYRMRAFRRYLPEPTE